MPHISTLLKDLLINDHFGLIIQLTTDLGSTAVSNTLQLDMV